MKIRLLLCLALLGCSDDDDGSSGPQNFTLTVTPSGDGEGTVTSDLAGINCPTDCSHDFAANTNVVLTPTAGSGSVFSRWLGGGCSGTGACDLTLTANETVTSRFALPDTVYITLAGTGGGTVTSDAGFSCSTTCWEVFNFTSVTLTATADASSIFTGWSGGACTGTAPCTIPSIEGAHGVTLVTATFDAAAPSAATPSRPPAR